jgi:tetratricopeptide (TPR) repeat protein
VAESLFLKAIFILEKNFGPNHIRISASLNNLAKLYQMQKRYDLAEPLYLRSVAIREKNDADNPNSLIILNNLAEMYREQGKNGQVESIETKVKSYSTAQRQ